MDPYLGFLKVSAEIDIIHTYAMLWYVPLVFYTLTHFLILWVVVVNMRKIK